jgi:hypothetical protein
MTDKELMEETYGEHKDLMTKVWGEYTSRKVELNKDLHDFDYGELYLRYELCEWLDTIVREYADTYEELLDFLKQQNHPLDYMYNVMLEREDSMWDNIEDAMNYAIWRQSYNENCN